MPETMRPGGLSVTERALDLISPKAGGRILDVGCGGGATVSLLRERGFEAYGVDARLESGLRPELILADAVSLPFGDNGMDAVFFECSLSKIDRPEKALSEARRVLSHGGSLVVTDLFTRGAPKSFEGLLGRLDTWPAVLAQVERAGFELCFFEEHGDALATFWAQLVFDCGLDEAKRLVCGCADDLKSSDSSYFLAVFKAV